MNEENMDEAKEQSDDIDDKDNNQIIGEKYHSCSTINNKYQTDPISVPSPNYWREYPSNSVSSSISSV